MQRRTFLATAGAASLTPVAGCSVLDTRQDRDAPTPTGSWPQAAGGPGNTARAPAPTFDTRVWAVDLPNESTTPPVVADGVVVIGTSAGTVQGFDLATGERLWRLETAGVQATPALVDGFAVVPADDGRLHRVSLTDGSQRPPLDIGSSLLGAVSVADGRAYLLARPGTLVAVGVADWRVDWTTPLDHRAVGKPAVAGDRVVVAGTRADGAGDVIALAASSGEPVWRARGTKAFASTPVIDHGSVVVAAAHHTRLESWTADDDWTPSGLFWFGVGSGTLTRTAQLRGPVWEHCSVRFLASCASETIASGCNGILGYGPEMPTWSTTLPQGVATRPLVTPDGLLVGDSDGRFWLVHDGRRRRDFAVDGRPTTPAVLDRGVVLTAGRRLVARV